MPEVTNVRMEASSSGGRHEHIAGVCTLSGTYYTRPEVAKGVDNGEDWHTRDSNGVKAQIKTISYCPHAGCPATPYITTRPDDTTKDNLDKLPRC